MMNFNLERELKKYPLDEDTRDGCNVCSEGVLDEDMLREAHRTNEPRPKYLENGAVAWRKKREYGAAYHAWSKMADKYHMRVTSPDGYKELGEEEEDDEQKISMDMLPIETKETEALPEKSYPLTLESKKKHFEKVNHLKKEEKRTALESVQKKREELRKLKDAYKEQAMKIECHKEERKEDYERRKQKYLENLAKQQNVDVNILKTRGDEVYKAYRKECRLWQEMRLEKVRRQEEAVKLLELEGRRQQGSPEEVCRAGEGGGIYCEKANLEQVFEEARLALMPKEPEQQQQEPMEEINEEMVEREALRLRVDSIVGKRILSKSPKFIPKKNKTAETIHSPQSSKSLKSKKSRINKPPIELYGDVYPSCRGRDPRNQSELAGELLEAVEEMERTLEEKAELEEKKAEKVLRLDQRIVATPTSIHFQDYYPAETKKINIVMYNTTTKKMYLQFWKMEYEQPTDSKLIQVMPIEIMKIWPGHCRRVEVALTSITWEKSEELKGKMWFWSCRPPSCSNIGYIVIDVLCSRATPDPYVLNKELNFFDKESWNKQIYKEYLTIENRGSMECRLYIRRESNIPLVHAEIINTEETPDENKGKPKRRLTTLRRPQSVTDVEYLLEEVLEVALSPFRVLLSRGRVLEAFSTLSVPVRFAPWMMDDLCALDRLRVVFEGYASWGKEETVLLCGSVKPPVLDVVPSVVDMKTLVIGGRGNQTAFTVRNTTGSFHTLRCKVPANLSKHFHVEPTSILSRPYDENKFVVKSHLGWDFPEDAKDYLNEFKAVLEFNLEVASEKHAPSKLVVLGTMAHPLCISLEPDAIDFGLVNTTETSVRDFWVINHSMMEHHVAFLNLPQWLLIMPGYGSLKMGPCERRKLQLQYSPTYVQAGRPGGKAEHTFQIKCTTVRRLSTLQANMPLEITEQVKEINGINIPNEQEEVNIIQDGKTDGENVKEGVLKNNEPDIQYPEGFLYKYIPPVVLYHTLEETVSSRKKRKDSLTLTGRRLSPTASAAGGSRSPQNIITIRKRRESDPDDEDAPPSDAAADEPQDGEEAAEPSQEKWMRDQPDIDIPYVTLLGKAVVLDPFSQLSHKKIIFPATPHTSYSIVPIYVSCPSELSGPSCDCGKFVGLQDDPRCRVNGRFEFSSDNKLLSIEPASGTLKHGEKIKVNLIFKPKLHGKEVEKLVDEAKKKRNPNRSTKFSKKAVKKLGLSAINHARRNHPAINDMALYNSMKQDLLKCTKREVFRVNVYCLVETTFTQEPFDKRTEVLTCQLCCPLIRPDFVIWAPDKHIVPDLEFPVTSVGQKSKIHLEIHNINWKTIFLRTTVLDLDNTFYTTIVPPVSSCLPRNIDKGIPLVPQDYIKFDIIYAPTHFGKHSGAIVFSANNTIVECKFAGVAKHPQFKLNPTFGFIKMEAKEGQRVIELIKVVNKGVTNIDYHMSICFEREIYKRYIFELNVQNSIKNKYEPVTNDVVKGLIKDFSNNCQKKCPISIEPKELNLKPGATGEFRIIFFPQLNTNQKELENNNPPPKEDDECNYVKRVVITLGSSTIVADWTILGLVKHRQISAPPSIKKKRHRK